MADKSAIEWTDATWNPTRGCTRVSPGCGGANHQGGCYAEKIAARFSGPGQPFAGYAERTAHGGRWTGKLGLAEDMLELPLRWKKPRRIFVNSMSDLFHEALPDEAIDQVFARMALAPQHTFQVLTKRPARMRAYFEERWQGTPAQRMKVGDSIIDMPAGGETGREHQVEIAVEAVLEDFPEMTDPDNDALWTEAGNLKIRQYKWPLPNVWLGISAERQEEADQRIPDLLETPAAKRFISAEPLLGPLDLVLSYGGWPMDVLRGWTQNTISNRYPIPKLDWVIAGGESGPNARPMHPDWARSLRDQCQAAGVPYFFKQFGEWVEYSQVGATEWTFIEERAGARYGFIADDKQGLFGGKLFETRYPFDDRGDNGLGRIGPCMVRVGKKAAGAVLDGREWREFPTHA
jgi:protein gp37